MCSFLLCGLVLVLDAAFALSSAKTLHIDAFLQTWAGVPVSVWAGLAGIVFLVVLTFAISLFAFRTSEARR